MNNDLQWFEKCYFPGQKSWIRNKKIKAFLWGFFIAAFLFTSLGYAWRMVQIDASVEMRERHIAYTNSRFLDAREKIADLEARLGICQGKNKKQIIPIGKRK